MPTGETNAVCIGNTPGPTFSVQLCATVNVTGKTVYYKPPETTISGLPSNHGITIVTDAANANTCSTGGGSTKVPCWWNGSAWTPLGGAGGGGGTITSITGTTNEICITNGSGPTVTAALCSTVSLLSKVLQVGRIDLAGDINATVNANTDNWNPTGLSTASTIRLTTDTTRHITGLQGGADGRILTLYNVGSFPAIFDNENAGSTAANRWGFGSDLTIGPSQGVLIQYDSTLSRWRSLTAPFFTDNYAIDSGSTDAYAGNLSPTITAYTIGRHYNFRANTANTGAATLSLNGLAAITIKKAVGGITTDLDTNDIRAGQIVQVVYDGTNFQMQSMLGNAVTGITGTLTTTCLPKAASSSTLNDSSACEDADSLNIAKPLEVGSVGNAAKFKATGVSGLVNIEAQTLRKKVIHFVIGADNGSALTDADDQPDVWENQIAAMHILSVKCRTDAGTSTINLQRNDGSAADILSSNLTCSTSGATSTSFVSGEDAIAVGQMIDFKMVTAGGTAKRVAVTITAQVDSE